MQSDQERQPYICDICKNIKHCDATHSCRERDFEGFLGIFDFRENLDVCLVSKVHFSYTKAHYHIQVVVSMECENCIQQGCADVISIIRSTLERCG